MSEKMGMEELLKALKRAFQCGYAYEEKDLSVYQQAYKQIKALIEQKPKVDREWIASQLMKYAKPGKHTSKGVYKTAIFKWCVIVEGILKEVGMEIINSPEKTKR